MKNSLLKFLLVISLLAGTLSLTGCANDSSDSTATPASTTTTTSTPTTSPTASPSTADGTVTEGTVSASSVTKNEAGQNVATISDSNGGIYVLTENTQTQINQAAALTSGTWVYKIQGVIKFSGTFTGDITKIGKENLNIELTVTKTTNSINEEVKVVSTKTFKIEFTTTKFTAVIPKVVSGVMDLRIKGGNIANKDNIYDCTQTFNKGTATEQTFTTAHVKATVYTNGVYFEVTRPTDECYLPGWGATVNPIEADGTKSTRLFLNGDNENTKYGFWPLCIKDKKIKFSIYMEPSNVDQYRQFTYDETIEITPQGGIGEIDYSNFDAKQWFTYGWENGKPVIKFDSSELVVPNGANLETRISFYAGNGVWENNATIWVKVYAVAGAKYEINLPDDELEDLKKKVADKGKNQIYYEYMFQFKIPGLDNQYFTTKLFKTTAVDIK